MSAIKRPPAPGPVPAVALDLAEAFKAAGWPLYLVGGWVRDALLGSTPPDLDFATPAPPDRSLEVMRRWGKKGGTSKVWTTGIEFGTVAAQRSDTRVEVTTFRTERYEPGSRNPTVAFATDLETDLSRRDFTVNAMAIELPDVALIDPFGGLDDLAQGRLRTPLSPEVAFGDDPLRMLRALRFASTLDFAPEGVTVHHHEVVGAEMAEARLRALRYPSHTIAEVRQLVYLHLRLHSYRLGWTDKAVRRYVRDAGALLDKLNTLVRSDCTTRNPRKAAQLSARIDELEARIRELAAQEEL